MTCVAWDGCSGAAAARQLLLAAAPSSAAAAPTSARPAAAAAHVRSLLETCLGQAAGTPRLLAVHPPVKMS